LIRPRLQGGIGVTLRCQMSSYLPTTMFSLYNNYFFYLPPDVVLLILIAGNLMSSFNCVSKCICIYVIFLLDHSMSLMSKMPQRISKII
jgi:hypothetical protein